MMLSLWQRVLLLLNRIHWAWATTLEQGAWQRSCYSLLSWLECDFNNSNGKGRRGRKLLYGKLGVRCECRRMDCGIHNFDKWLVERGAFKFLPMGVNFFVILETKVHLVQRNSKLFQGRLESYGFHFLLFLGFHLSFSWQSSQFSLSRRSFVFCWPWNQFSVDHIVYNVL